MTATPPGVDEVIEDVRRIVLEWERKGWRGEIVIIVGDNQYLPDERPTFRGKATKRHPRGSLVARI